MLSKRLSPRRLLVVTCLSLPLLHLTAPMLAHAQGREHSANVRDALADRLAAASGIALQYDRQLGTYTLYLLTEGQYQANLADLQKYEAKRKQMLDARKAEYQKSANVQESVDAAQTGLSPWRAVELGPQEQEELEKLRPEFFLVKKVVRVGSDYVEYKPTPEADASTAILPLHQVRKIIVTREFAQAKMKKSKSPASEN